MFFYPGSCVKVSINLVLINEMIHLHSHSSSI
jgi:hypothetical protein